MQGLFKGVCVQRRQTDVLRRGKKVNNRQELANDKRDATANFVSKADMQAEVQKAVRSVLEQQQQATQEPLLTTQQKPSHSQTTSSIHQASGRIEASQVKEVRDLLPEPNAKKAPITTGARHAEGA